MSETWYQVPRYQDAIRRVAETKVREAREWSDRTGHPGFADYFPTEQEARDHIITRAHDEVQRAKRALVAANRRLARVTKKFSTPAGGAGPTKEERE